MDNDDLKRMDSLFGELHGIQRDFQKVQSHMYDFAVEFSRFQHEVLYRLHDLARDVPPEESPPPDPDAADSTGPGKG